MKQTDGSIKEQWMLSTVVVKADTVKYTDENGEEMTRTVTTNSVTKLYFADSLEDLSNTATRKELSGPEWMKDLRICPLRSRDSEGKPVLRYIIYGRPQGEVLDEDGKVLYNELGNITFAIVDSLDDIEKPEVQYQLRNNFLKPDLFPGNRWGGATDAIQLNETNILILAHDAKKTGEKGEGHYYTPILLIHNIKDPANPILIELGPIAPPESFPSDEKEYAAKADRLVDHRKVVFSGGFSTFVDDEGGISVFIDDEGGLILEITAGYRDSRIARAVVRLTEEQCEIIRPLLEQNKQEQFELAA